LIAKVHLDSGDNDAVNDGTGTMTESRSGRADGRLQALRTIPGLSALEF
jgi:hypothetical protein